MTTRSPGKLRIISQMNEKIDGIVMILGVKKISHEHSFKERLRALQVVVSVCNAVIDRVAEYLDIAGAVREQFRSEIKRLEATGYHTALGYKTTDAFEQMLSRLEKSVVEFFRQPKYHVGKSQRYVSLVFNEAPWRLQLEKLVEALSRPTTGTLSVVGGTESVKQQIELILEEGFEERYNTLRELHCYPQVASNVYALCGVAGGRDTGEFSAEMSLRYFKDENRVPLTHKSAAALYTSHPDFLSNGNANVVLLGERCIDHQNGDKFVTLSFDEANGKLYVGLASLKEVDRAYQLRAPAPHAFHGDPVSKKYGKPSAGAIILP